MHKLKPNFEIELLNQISFVVKVDESIDDKVNSGELKGKLPKGLCNMFFYDPRSNLNVFGRNPRLTGKVPNGQNIFSYFKNSGSKTYPKWKQLQEEMQEKNIPEVKVIVKWNKE